MKDFIKEVEDTFGVEISRERINSQWDEYTARICGHICGFFMFGECERITGMFSYAKNKELLLNLWKECKEKPSKTNKTLTFGEAIHELIVNNKRVRVKTWKKELFLKLDQAYKIPTLYTYHNAFNEVGLEYTLCVEDYNKVWEIFEVPKSKNFLTFNEAMHELFENGKKIAFENWNDLYLERILGEFDHQIAVFGGRPKYAGKKYDIQDNEYKGNWEICGDITKLLCPFCKSNNLWWNAFHATCGHCHKSLKGQGKQFTH